MIKQLSKFVATFVLTILLSMPALFPNKAQAACSYSNTTSANQYGVLVNEKFTVTIKVKRTGDLNDCNADQIKAKLIFKTRDGKDATNYPPRNDGGESWTEEVKFNGENGQDVKFVVAPSQLDKAYWSSDSTIQFKARIYAVKTFSSPIVNESSYMTVTVTGSGTASGALSTQVTFKTDDASGTSKSIYGRGDKIQAHLHINGTPRSVNDLDSSITKLYMVLKVNGKQAVSPFERDRRVFAEQGDQYFTGIEVSTANGFKDGANNITMELWGAGTNLKLSTATVNLQATGLGTTTLPTNTNNANNTQTKPPVNNTQQSGGGEETGGDLGGVETITPPIAIGSVGELIIRIINYLISLIAALTVLMIIYGGFRMVMSGGSETALTAGKKTVTWAVLGLVTTLLAFTIVNVIQSLLNKK